MRIIVRNGVACGTHVFTKLKFANTFLDQFANFNARQNNRLYGRPAFFQEDIHVFIKHGGHQLHRPMVPLSSLSRPGSGSNITTRHGSSYHASHTRLK